VTQSGSIGATNGSRGLSRFRRATAIIVRRPLIIPSGGQWLGPRPRVRLIALLAARDEMQQLPAWLRNVGPQVDGVVALDDGSSDGTGEWLSAQHEVLEVVRVPAGRPQWDEVANHRALVAAAHRHAADWAICIDADERLERKFRARAETVIGRGRLLGLTAYLVRLRELWGRPDRYRIDGIWGRKAVARLFRLRPDHLFDERPLHARKTPAQARHLGRHLPLADLELYHLGVLTPERRRARREKYERIDPRARWQPGTGYAYLTDDADLRVRRVRARRSYVE
jgi:glycosyltransferase involved in cell wall biosynthesis